MSKNKNIQQNIKDAITGTSKKQKAAHDLTQMQMTLKNNSENLQDYLKDLDSWAKDIKKKDQFTHERVKKPTTKAEKAKASVPLPPIRNKVEVDKFKEKKKGQIFTSEDTKDNSKKVKNAKKKNVEAEKLKRDTTPMFNYYKDWDKFADEALKDMEEGQSSDDDEAGVDGFTQAKNPKFEEEDGPQSQAEMMRLTSGAKPNTQIVIKGGTIKKNSMADQLKAQGNAFFMSLEFDKAIDCYTRCIPQVPESDHSLRTIVYSNKAQCYIKLGKYDQAYKDADKALTYDPSHLKSIQRRATAAYYTKRLRQARKDFMHCLSIEFSQKFTDDLAKVLQQLEKAKVAANEKLTRQVYFDSGVNFHSNKKDLDLSKKEGINSFKMQSHQVECKEMNLDQEQIKQMKAKKEEMLKILNRSQEDQEIQFKSKEKTEEKQDDSQKNTEKTEKERKKESKKEKKKNKKKSKKGIDAFLDDDKEAKYYQDNEVDKVTNIQDDKAENVEDKDELKGSSLIQEIETPPVKEQKIAETAKQTVESPREEEEANNEAESEYDEMTQKKEKQPKGLLMGPNEFNTTKTVTIDEDANVVKEFMKSQKIDRGKPKKQLDKREQIDDGDKSNKQEKELKGKKAKKAKQKEKREAKASQIKNKETEVNSQNSENQDKSESKENESQNSNVDTAEDSQAKKSLRDYKEISELQKSDAVIEARDKSMLAEAPKNYYSFERDFKSLKNEPDKLCKYLMVIKKDDIKKIFKNDLETDILLAIYSNLLSQNDQFHESNVEQLQGFVDGFSSVGPFDMACEFLMDDEKDTIKKLIQKISKSSKDADGMQKIQKIYAKKCDINF